MGDLVKTTTWFKGRRVLITGDTGFKGAWLSWWLADAGADVSGFALPPRHPDDHFCLLDLGRRIDHQDGDIRDARAVCARFESARPEVVFHLAAQPLVRRSYRDPKETFDTNVGGLVNVLEGVRATESIRAFVCITSDKCYRNQEWVWGYRETDELGGHDPYSASKAAAEIVCASYGASFFGSRPDLGWATTRAGNVIGGGDWSEDRIVPDCVRALRAGQPIVLRKPAATRPWQHVLEPLGGYLTLAVALASDPVAHAGAWNFGPASGDTYSVLALAERIIQRWGEGEVVVQPSPGDPHEAGLLALSCDKARLALGWRPRWGFERTVDETVNWYRAVLAGQAVAAVSSGQIAIYMESHSD